jgi:hypothetical protein
LIKVASGVWEARMTRLERAELALLQTWNRGLAAFFEAVAVDIAAVTWRNKA